jgi:ABC-type dipeptide/oligopeptide/nickel transport system permease component
MLTRFISRLIWSVVTLLGAVALTFFLLNALPGDVARVIAGPKASPDVIKEIHAKYHLDDPLWKRFALYLGQLARGDLGQLKPS